MQICLACSMYKHVQLKPFTVVMKGEISNRKPHYKINTTGPRFFLFFVENDAV